MKTIIALWEHWQVGAPVGAPEGAMLLTSEALRRQRGKLQALGFAIPRRTQRHERTYKRGRGGSHLLHRAVECGLIRLGWRIEPTQFAHELQRGRMDLVVRRRRCEVVQR